MVSLSRMRNLIGYEQRLRWNYTKKMADATRVTSVLTGMPRGSGSNSQVEAGAIELSEVDNAYREVFEELTALRDELEPLLYVLDNADDLGVMRLRYLDGHAPKDIPDAVYLTERSVYYHLCRAERKLMDAFPDKVVR